MKEHTAIKKKLENRRLDYDAKVNRLSKSKKEKPALEEEMKVAQAKYYETLKDMEVMMEGFAAQEELLLESLVTFARGQYEYFKNGVELLDGIDTFLRSDRLTEQISQNAENPDQAAMMRRRRSITDEKAVFPSSMGTLSNDSLTEQAPPDYAPRPIDNGPDRYIEEKFAGVDSGSISKKALPAVMVMPNVGLKDKVDRGQEKAKNIFGGRGEISSSSSSLSPQPQTERSSQSKGPADEHVEALYDFEAALDGEMAIRKGDIIRVTSKDDEGWWQGECADGRSGLFPANYVKACTEEASPGGIQARPTKADAPPNGKSSEQREDGWGTEQPAGKSGRPPSSTATPMRPSIGSLTLSDKTKSTAVKAALSKAHGGSAIVSLATMCGECGCKEFSANVFKAGQCNNCFHRH